MLIDRPYLECCFRYKFKSSTLTATGVFPGIITAITTGGGGGGGGATGPTSGTFCGYGSDGKGETQSARGLRYIYPVDVLDRGNFNGAYLHRHRPRRVVYSYSSFCEIMCAVA